MTHPPLRRSRRVALLAASGVAITLVSLAAAPAKAPAPLPADVMAAG